MKKPLLTATDHAERIARRLGIKTERLIHLIEEVLVHERNRAAEKVRAEVDILKHWTDVGFCSEPMKRLQELADEIERGET
jgi:hypothetical protein